MNKPKYSIVIPVNNVINYLPSTIESIVSQDYADYELIISDDNSTDGTAEYINSLNHPNIKTIHTPNHLTMAEHFNWALSHAIGEWCMFIGGDDGLQPYFFKLADRLTEIATKKNIRAIASRRAYFFWNGCQPVYGDVAVSYSAANKYEVKHSKREMYKVLYSKTPCGYFELPQMYTVSLFHVSLINEIKQKQNGIVINYGIADAFLAALSLCIEKKYIYSNIPLGWIGTSPKILEKTYTELIISHFTMHPKCGDFKLRSNAIYYYGALLTNPFLDMKLKEKLESYSFLKKITIYIYRELIKNKDFIKSEQYLYFLNFLKINNLSFDEICKKAFKIEIRDKICKILFKPISFVRRVIQYSLKQIRMLSKNYKYGKDCKLYITHSEYQNITLQQASSLILELVNQHNILRGF